MRESLAGDHESWRALIASNATAVRERFSLESTGADLAAIYQSLMNSAPCEAIAGLPESGKILDAFLDVRRLNPVRVEP